MTLRRAAFAVAFAWVLAPSAAPSPAASCPSGASGIVDVAAFDGDGDAVITSRELQRAVDCLDGDPDSEAWSPSGAMPAGRLLAGGTLVLAAGLAYRIDRPVDLPWAAGGCVRVRGQGAVLRGDDSSPEPMLRRAPVESSDASTRKQWQLDATNWVIEDVVFRGPAGRTTSRTGLRVVGSTALVVRNCGFEDLAVGVDLRAARLPSVEDCRFRGCRENGVRVDDATSLAVRRSRFELVASQPAGIRLVGVANALVDQVEIVPATGSVGLLAQDSAGDSRAARSSRQLLVRESSDVGDCAGRHAFLRVEASGQVIVEGLYLWRSGGATLAYDGSAPGAEGQDVIFDGLLANAGIRFSGTERSRFLFRDAQSWTDAGAGQDLDARDPALWIGTMPTDVFDERFASPDLHAPCMPAAPAPGQLVWYDPRARAARCPPGSAAPTRAGLYYWAPEGAWMRVETK